MTLAYRHWVLTHRGEFNLIFSDQLPGYQAPPGGPTIAAQTNVFAPIVDALHDLDSPELPAEELAVVWTAFHGAVTLEVKSPPRLARRSGRDVRAGSVPRGRRRRSPHPRPAPPETVRAVGGPTHP
ncbi:TetR-like C-terminal domain-containing protein [Rhodococcus wratislaviensis]|uniref:TetR-like C-terminal domain-containing protein n=1 Tax=Rhodococcus wratislaviensis TaxID=44752 RepID=UPI000F5735EA|nr:TetR-like C-terminal domain-containing protein [Rhodococcus wratislaviensis]